MTQGTMGKAFLLLILLMFISSNTLDIRASNEGLGVLEVI